MSACHSCNEPVLGRGVVLLNDHGDERWVGEVGDYFHVFDNGVQFMVLHPVCFDKVWATVTQLEDHNVALTLCFGGIGDILQALTTDED